jgi:uncharacterized OB-fold protein
VSTTDTRPPRPRPPLTRDNAFFFEAAARRRLVIQRCADCGRLRHPPGPMCPDCRSLDWVEQEATGRGTVHSFVVAHHPQVPSFDYPLAVVLVELAEGTRLVSNLLEVDPDDIEIGMEVEVTFLDIGEGLGLPLFRPAGATS